MKYKIPPPPLGKKKLKLFYPSNRGPPGKIIWIPCNDEKYRSIHSRENARPFEKIDKSRTDLIN